MSRKCMADKRCEGCWYWRPLGAVEGLKVCHYCIDHHELRKRDGEKCLSFKAKFTPLSQPAADSSPARGEPNGHEM